MIELENTAEQRGRWGIEKNRKVAYVYKNTGTKKARVACITDSQAPESITKYSI